ncbi:hypothetical protein MGG_17871 [Pyricularia oryzae 70-15]|uniref:Uncharacterized protein n=2 Tax=Pyricularia oryzae TaxID=318829 RepID=G4NKH1_PYRO7|nr:uncharacterized protein MGG_17871 [Pyricularia oryzae 70-15]EHA45846.1 hypothetical protein MGG_17871 [Pyricularia oryzae 70-15]ELQ41002.1 hypothetical protein OOU_Y34scaffold00308g12 [Pyricularia oryzae Y34]
MTLCEIVVKRTVANQGAINKSGMLSICLLIPGKAKATTLTTIKTRSFEYSLLAAPGVYLSHQRMVLWGIPASGHRQIYQAQKSASEDQISDTKRHIRRLRRGRSMSLSDLSQDLLQSSANWRRMSETFRGPGVGEILMRRHIRSSAWSPMPTQQLPLHFGAATGNPGLAGIKNSGLSHLWLTWLKKCKKVAQPGNRRQGCYRMDQRTGSGRVGSPVGKSAGSITERASQSAEKEVISKLYKKRHRQRPRNKISILWWTTLGKRNAVRVAIKQPVQRAVFDVETSDGVPECRSPCVCHNESLAVPKPSADPHESRGLGGD